jgi:hypothetical protein
MVSPGKLASLGFSLLEAIDNPIKAFWYLLLVS